MFEPGSFFCPFWCQACHLDNIFNGTIWGGQSYDYMGRRPRVYYPGAIYHVMARGVDGRNIFIDDQDRAAFLDGMRLIAREASAEIIAYCLMGNHFHLAVKVGAVPLSAFMQRLLTAYCMRFNRRHDRTGHLFQARYKAILCLDDRYLAGLIRYIHLNPVRAGLVPAPQDWPWSNFKPGERIGDEIMDFDPWPKGQDSDLLRNLNDDKSDLEAIGLAVALGAGIGLDDLRSDSECRSVIGARRQFARDAVKAGYAMVAVARWLKASPRTVSRYVRGKVVLVAGLTPV